MTSLIDVVPIKRDVAIQNGAVTLQVSGLSLASIATLIDSFPLVKDLFNGKTSNLSVENLIAAVPGLVGAVIAAASGHPGDPGWVAAANALSADDQAALFEATLKETMPDGVGPFVAKVTRALGVVAGDVDDTKEAASSTPKAQKS